MSFFQFVYNDSLKRRRAVAYPGFVDTVTVNGGSPATNFNISGATIDSSSAIDVWVDGRMQTEGTHYTRDTGNNRVTFTSNVNATSEVRIRVFLK